MSFELSAVLSLLYRASSVERALSIVEIAAIEFVKNKFSLFTIRLACDHLTIGAVGVFVILRHRIFR